MQRLLVFRAGVERNSSGLAWGFFSGHNGEVVDVVDAVGVGVGAEIVVVVAGAVAGAVAGVDVLGVVADVVAVPEAVVDVVAGVCPTMVLLAGVAVSGMTEVLADVDASVGVGVTTVAAFCAGAVSVLVVSVLTVSGDTAVVSVFADAAAVFVVGLAVCVELDLFRHHMPNPIASAITAIAETPPIIFAFFDIFERATYALDHPEKKKKKRRFFFSLSSMTL